MRASLVSATSLGITDGVNLSITGLGVIADSTIVLKNGSQRGFYGLEPSMRFINNAFISTGNVTKSGGLVIEGPQAYDYLEAIANNQFIAFPTQANKSCAYARDPSYATCADPNTVSMSADPRPYLGGNTSHTLAEAQLDSAYHPSATSSLARAGISTTSDVCRKTSSAPFEPVATPACGAVSLDVEGQPFEAPAPTIGCFKATPS